MYKPLLFLLGLLLMAQALLFAQKKVTSTPPAVSESIQARIAEMTAYAQITPQRQVVLARYFAKRDSLILREAAKGDPKGLSALITNLDKEFTDLLTTGERIRYADYRYGPYFRWEAAETANYLAQRYQARPAIRQWIQNTVLDRQHTLARSSVTTAQEIDRMVIFQNLQRYDSLLAIYRIAAKGEPYLQARLTALDQIKPLDEQQRRKLADHFMSLCLSKGDDYNMNFRTALQLTTPDPIYHEQLSRDSIEQEVQRRGQEELAQLLYKYGLSNTLSKALEPIVLSKQRKALSIELQYPYNRTRDSLLRENQEISWAAMKQLLIRNGHYRLGNSRFVYTMAFRKVLKLSDRQLDSLAHKNYQLDLQAYQYSLIDPWNSYDGEAFIRHQLGRILRQGQYDTLLLLESNPRSFSKTMQNWKDIKVSKLAPPTDSAMVCNEIFNYHLAYTSIQRRYAGDVALQSRLLQQVSDRKPAVLRRLEAALKLQEYESPATQASR